MNAGLSFVVVGSLSALSVSAFAGPVAPWVEFTDETALRLIADPSRGVNDQAEKDFAWGDLDKDGDIDLVVMRKTETSQACSVNPSLCPNVLFMLEGTAEGHALEGIYVDRTLEYATDADDGGQGFFDVTNDRDVVVIDVDGDTWLDVVTAVTVSDGLPKTISHPRVYINKGNDAGGDWLGLRYEESRFPQLHPMGNPGLNVAPRFCAVAVGRITNDDAPDLYFSDYDTGVTGPPMPVGHDLNDRLLINDGNGFFTDSLETRMSSQMLLSNFSMAVAIEDMNIDGVVDVVKDTALGPYLVSISYNKMSDEGFFDTFSVIASGAPYHTTVGNLNNDEWPDLVIVDDGVDYYMLNEGNGGGSGPVSFINFAFNSGPGFGGNTLIEDLDNDGFNDVIITDHDADIFGCAGQTHIYRNLGGPVGSNVVIQEEGAIAPWAPTGTYDVAAIDINGDSFKDLIYGTCSMGTRDGIEIWASVPPFGFLYFYDEGVPAQSPPDAVDTFPVRIESFGGGNILSAELHVSVNGGPFTVTTLTLIGANTYDVTLPAADCTDTISFFIAVQAESGTTFSDPPGAPAVTHDVLVTQGVVVTLRDEIEGDVTGWTITNDPSLESGVWEQAEPIGTAQGGDLVGPEFDATAGAGNVRAFITQNGTPGGAVGDADVDGGPTTLTSPVINLAGSDATISYSRWFVASAGTVLDYLLVEVTENGTDWVLVESVGSNLNGWQSASFKVGDFVVPNATVQVRFSTVDDPNDSFVEAGIDNFQVEELTCFSGVCPSPVAVAAGPRYLAIAPVPPALVRTAITIKPACIGGGTKYVGQPVPLDIDGDGVADENVASLVDGVADAAFLTEAEWGELYVFGAGIAPDTDYEVRNDCGSAGSSVLSNPITARTFSFGDANNDTVANFADIFLAVNAFQGDFSNVMLVATDGHPCVPNQVANFGDIFNAVQAFQGVAFDALGCPAACP